MWDLPGSGIKPCLLHWQADSLPLSHQESPQAWSCWPIRLTTAWALPVVKYFEHHCWSPQHETPTNCTSQVGSRKMNKIKELNPMLNSTALGEDFGQSTPSEHEPPKPFTPLPGLTQHRTRLLLAASWSSSEAGPGEKDFTVWGDRQMDDEN